MKTKYDARIGEKRDGYHVEIVAGEHRTITMVERQFDTWQDAHDWAAKMVAAAEAGKPGDPRTWDV